jgi:hypothetical protein
MLSRVQSSSGSGSPLRRPDANPAFSFGRVTTDLVGENAPRLLIPESRLNCTCYYGVDQAMRLAGSLEGGGFSFDLLAW